ncbi:MAG: iron-containing alcohol dehydrogenase [Deltaproteobacteria bacterium]|jgi:alcohol dehydrogenase class IV|nr:iron-containing alcohol dehydrogenase [Deltaproteobacteria bacterium]
MNQNQQSKTHVFYSPTKIAVGLNSASLVADEVKQFGGGRVLVVTDPGVVAADLIAPIASSLKSGNIDYVIYDGVEPEPPSRVIDRGAEVFQSEGCDLVLGVGGGSSLDVAKGISILASNKGKILDYCGVDQVPQNGAPMILMPTTAGTGSEVTRVLVLTDEEQNTKNVVFTPYALANAAIVDPLLTISMPPSVTADTGMDAMVHAIETFVSINATVFSDTLAEKAILLIGEYLPVAWAKGSNTEARYHMSLAATLAGMAFGSGGLGAVHALAYPLGTEYHMTHGRTNAIMLPHVMRYNLPGSPEKYAWLAELMGQDTAGYSPMDAAELAVVAIQELLKTIRVSHQIRDYGIPEADLPQLVAGGLKQSRLFVPNPRDLTEEDVAAIYKEAY